METDNLDRDYNIYIFHGTDGDDWDRDGRETIPEIRKMIGYSSRIGITITSGSAEIIVSSAEKYIRDSKVLDEHSREIRLDAINEDATEARLIEGIKKLIA